MTEAKIKKLVDEPMIWINTAILIYFAGVMFYNVLFTLLLEYSKHLAIQAAIFNAFLNITFYVLIAIGFCKGGKQQNVVIN